jgi:hypothetical protein
MENGLSFCYTNNHNLKLGHRFLLHRRRSAVFLTSRITLFFTYAATIRDAVFNIPKTQKEEKNMTV